MSKMRLAIIAGEESADALGADLVQALRRRGVDVSLFGVGGRHLQAEGLVSLFDPHDIALMGLIPVLLRLPKLIRRIGETVRAIVAFRPDALIIVDNPDFTHRVAARVRAALPGLPVVNYVCPSVWAWRPQRAPKMKAYVDRVLCLLPFEPAELAHLGGPPGVYVGHRLISDAGMQAAQAAQATRQRHNSSPLVLAMPGSRRSEIRGLVDRFGRGVEQLAERIGPFELLMPAVPRLEAELRQRVAGWRVTPQIITAPADKWAAFGRADAALAASGTTLLELALAGVPAISCYQVDPIMLRVAERMPMWSAALPNIIADRVVFDEYYNQMIRPGLMARQLEALIRDGARRDMALAGMAEVRRRMAVERPAGEAAADAVLDVLAK